MFSNKKILIADPDRETRQLLSLILRKEGYTPIEAGNARETYRMIRSKTEFVGVVFDLLMPNIDAVQLLKFIRSETRMGELPVLAIAAEAGVAHIQECFTAGTTMFLPKPFTQERLCSALSILLKSRMKRFDLRQVFAA
jgi:CheY-like chemotaxis protein